MKKLINQIKKNIVFIISVTISLFIIIYGYVCNEVLADIAESIMSWVSNKFGWLYILVVFSLIFFLAWIAFGKYGKIRLGDDNERPDYSNFSCFAIRIK